VHPVDPRDAEPVPRVLLVGIHVCVQPRARVSALRASLSDIPAGRGVLGAHLQNKDHEVRATYYETLAMALVCMFVWYDA
jgi:hypothetical protein